MRVTHSFVSAKPDIADTSKVRASDWNADHIIDTGNLVFVRSADDLPAAVNGVHTLADETTYFLTGDVDLNGGRIVCGIDTTIIGGSSENCVLSSTGLTGSALVSSAYSLPMRNISLTADIGVALDATGTPTAALDWFGVNFVDCPTIGTIANYNNFIASDCAFLNSAGFTFDGSIGTIGFSQCIFDSRTGSTIITLPATLTIMRRFRIIYSAFVVLSGETGVNFSSSATVPVEGYILDTVNFAGGGSYLAGVAYTENKALFVNNKGINNSAEVSYYTMNGNATETAIAQVGVPVKAAGTTVSQSITQKFTNTDNRATYTGAIARTFRVTATVSCTSGNNNQVGVYVAKNGAVIDVSESYITTNGAGRAEQAKVQAVVELATDDYIEIFVENDTGTNNITVTELSVIIESLN